MWVYWLQSITIGFFNFILILQLKEFSTEGFKINDRPTQPTQSTKIFTAFFFLFHFGFFHFGYLMFLLAGAFTKAYGNTLNSAELKFILLTALLFFINHLFSYFSFSYFYNKPPNTKKTKYRLAHVLPLSKNNSNASDNNFWLFVWQCLAFILVLKTFADAIMYVVEHNVLRKGEEQQTQII